MVGKNLHRENYFAGDERLQGNRGCPMAAINSRRSIALALLLVAVRLLTSLASAPPSVSAYPGNIHNFVWVFIMRVVANL